MLLVSLTLKEGIISLKILINGTRIYECQLTLSSQSCIISAVKQVKQVVFLHVYDLTELPPLLWQHIIPSLCSLSFFSSGKLQTMLHSDLSRQDFEGSTPTFIF